ncbi:unnamed protein product [Lathyrus sativus]|nr:unnamed protein product [Lathyrus sativus]
MVMMQGRRELLQDLACDMVQVCRIEFVVIRRFFEQGSRNWLVVTVQFCWLVCKRFDETGLQTRSLECC